MFMFEQPLNNFEQFFYLEGGFVKNGGTAAVILEKYLPLRI